jgi:hypothetical protein
MSHESCEKFDATTRELRRDASAAWDRFERSADAWMERVSAKLETASRSGRQRVLAAWRDAPRRARALGDGAWRVFGSVERAIDRRTRKLTI